MTGLVKIKGNTISPRYFCIDIETTGLAAKTEHIIEVFWMIMEYSPESGSYERVKHNHRIFFHPRWVKTKYLHDIPKHEIIGQPSWDSNDSDVILFKNELISYLDECIDEDSNLTLMAHYAPFERSWFTKHLMFDYQVPDMRVYDTRAVEKILYPELTHNLIDTCKRRGIVSPNGVNFHRADFDTTGMFMVAEQQMKELDK